MKGKISVFILVLVTIIVLTLGYLYLRKIMVDFEIDENTMAYATELMWNEPNRNVQL